MSPQWIIYLLTTICLSLTSAKTKESTKDVPESIKSKLTQELQSIKKPSVENKEGTGVKSIKEIMEELAKKETKQLSETDVGSMSQWTLKTEPPTTTVARVYTEGAPYTVLNSTTDVYDMRQVGEENYRANIKGVSILVAPISSSLFEFKGNKNAEETANDQYPAALTAKVASIFRKFKASNFNFQK